MGVARGLVSVSMALHNEDQEYDAIKPAAEFVLALRQGHHIYEVV